VADSDGNAVFDGVVGTTAAPQDLNFDNVTWVANGTNTVTITGGNFTQPTS
jgi:hypothetical protein